MMLIFLSLFAAWSKNSLGDSKGAACMGVLAGLFMGVPEFPRQRAVEAGFYITKGWR
jgi:hypothetical protein